MRIGKKKRQPKKFMEVESLEDFRKKYLMYYMQHLMLDKGFSYFDVTESNVDGTFFGEMFDNTMRLKFLCENNKEFMDQTDITALQEEAAKEVDEDLREHLAEHPEDAPEYTQDEK
jgi:hypothetical protein